MPSLRDGFTSMKACGGSQEHQQRTTNSEQIDPRKKSSAQIKREIDEILAKGDVATKRDMRHYHIGHAGSCGTSACLAQAEREEQVVYQPRHGLHARRVPVVSQASIASRRDSWRKGEPALFWAGTGQWLPVVIHDVTASGNPRIVHPVTGKLMVVRAKASLEKASPARSRSHAIVKSKKTYAKALGAPGPRPINRRKAVRNFSEWKDKTGRTHYAVTYEDLAGHTITGQELQRYRDREARGDVPLYR
jgi:hypothetical protein